MSSTVRGVIARKPKTATEIVDIVVPDPVDHDVVVKVSACGVCHTDLTYRDGGINDEFPFLLGHEAAGVVEAVGPDVSLVAPGDFVVLNWRAVCGAVPGMQTRAATVLLRHAQRLTANDSDRRHSSDPSAGDRCVRRDNTCARGAMHAGRRQR